MNAHFGILITSAALKDNHLFVEDMWNNFYGKPLYRVAMSKERFRFLTNCIRFDDKSTRDVRKVSDPFAAIREITDMFASNCQEMYTPSTCCTIDEQLLAFRGRFPFRMYIPNKPAKYGIKLVLCDSKTFYAVNMIPYVGKATHNGEIPLADYFVKEL
ncbi:piggyBac transposable element-derived protein 4-like [Stegodyphus dumicola]|uniref:piggyBac transposable element-derived protein 4-like n=1 Tax=Stegodyphus dumicola TaxID=202533 RepID=UPI0015AA9111|nr:piggyBac transposable element-derived protein 4-like [Stegodyphus dumicola]